MRESEIISAHFCELIFIFSLRKGMIRDKLKRRKVWWSYYLWHDKSRLGI